MGKVKEYFQEEGLRKKHREINGKIIKLEESLELIEDSMALLNLEKNNLDKEGIITEITIITSTPFDDHKTVLKSFESINKLNSSLVSIKEEIESLLLKDY